MLTRYFITWGFVLGLMVLFAPACVARVDSAEPEEETTAEASQKDDAPIDVTARFTCERLDVVECMIRCADQGTACRPRRKHPKKAAAGDGDLYACRTSPPRSCDYRYANGDRCFFYKSPDYNWCVYSGG
jgi:hypothetical protein